MQDTLLEDIERIEIVRGPGAAVWGANAVNGVINIITKRADKTHGGLIYALTGDEESTSGGMRYGGSLGESGDYRIYGKYNKRDEAVFANGEDASDEMDSLRGGFRMDWQNGDTLSTLQGDLYSSNVGERISVPNLLNPANGYKDSFDNDINYAGANLIARWRRDDASGGSEAWQFFYDHTKRDDHTLGNYNRDTYDLEYQRGHSRSGRQQLIWGMGYRFIRDELRSSSGFAVVRPARNKDELLSAFLQSDIYLFDDEIVVTLGARVEHNQYTGIEVQPSIRARWQVKPGVLWWAAVSRAVRTPSRIDHGGTTSFGIIPPSPATMGLPLELVGTQDGKFDSETVLAYELGYRQQLTESLSIDVTTFFMDYDDLRSGETIGTVFHSSPVPHLESTFISDNKVAGDSYGFEIAVQSQITDWWRMRANWSFLQTDLHITSGSTDTAFVRQEDEAPNQQFNFISSMSPAPGMEFDFTVRYVDQVKGFDIDEYVAVDTRLSWRFSKQVELSLVGQNLLDSSQPEYLDNIFDVSESEVERSIYARIELNF